MKDVVFEEQPFRVLRVVPIVPVVPVDDRDDESGIAFVDLVDVENNLIFPDCELYPPEDAYVRIPRSNALLQCCVQGAKPRDLTKPPVLPWQVDDEVIRAQTTVALNHFLGFPGDPESFVTWAINSPTCFFEGWKGNPPPILLEDPDWIDLWANLSASDFHRWLLDRMLYTPGWWEAWVASHEVPTLNQALAAFVAGKV